MVPILICIALPFLILALVSYLRFLFGDELFSLNVPPELNRRDDHRLLKLPINEPADKN